MAFGFFTFVDLRVVPKRYAARSGIILLFVLFVAILWEFFENFIGLAGFSIEHNYVLDTAIDLVMGLLGGVVGIFIGKQLRN